MQVFPYWERAGSGAGSSLLPLWRPGLTASTRKLDGTLPHTCALPSGAADWQPLLNFAVYFLETLEDAVELTANIIKYFPVAANFQFTSLKY